MKRICILLTLAMAMLAPGCAADRVVSRSTLALAESLTTISRDIQSNSNTYLSNFETAKLAEAAAAETATLAILTEQGKSTPENIAKVHAVFDGRRAQLEKNVAKARAAYRVRIEALQTAAKSMMEIDKYYHARNVKLWEAFFKGFAQGVLARTDELQTLMGLAISNPLTGGVSSD